jgi:uncharacterized protein
LATSAAIRREDGDVVAARCTVADSVSTRLRGLLGRGSLAADEALLLSSTGSVHTCFMRFPIDAVFLDGGLRVLAVASDLGPWRVAARRGARAVLELPSGAAARRGLEPGDRLLVGDAL